MLAAMGTKRDKNVEELERLQQLRDGGRLSEAEYDVKRAQVIAKASRVPMHWTVQLILSVVLVVVAFVLLRLLAPLLT